MKRVVLIGAVCAGVWLSGPARAQSAPDPMRCDALQMRREGQRIVCGSHCLAIAAGVAALHADAVDTKFSNCDQRCEDRYQAALQRIQQGPPCGPNPPDPNRCEARLLSAQARQIACRSRCLSQPPDEQGSCAQSCDDNYAAAQEEILASDICADGPAPNP